MRDLLRGSLARSLRSLSAEDRLATALPVVCGTALASHCDVDHLDDGQTLHLRVDEREWLGPLLAMREVLQHDLARISGVPLAGLHFQAEPLPSGGEASMISGRAAGQTTASAPGARTGKRNSNQNRSL